MNIHFEQVQKKSTVLSYLLAAFAVFTILMLTLSFTRHFELRLSVPSMSGQAAQTENSDLPVPIPAPLPPAEEAHSVSTPAPAENTSSMFVPQVVPVPVPSVP